MLRSTSTSPWANPGREILTTEMTSTLAYLIALEIHPQRDWALFEQRPRPISTQPALNPHTSGYQRFWSGFIESRSRSDLNSGTSEHRLVDPLHIDRDRVDALRKIWTLLALSKPNESSLLSRTSCAHRHYLVVADSEVLARRQSGNPCNSGISLGETVASMGNI